MIRALVALLILSAPAAAADFRLLVGHGGPVMAVDVSEDGTQALTASFDNSVGLWDLASDEVTWLEGHTAAVKSVIFLPGGRAASAGDDFAIAVWALETGESLARLTGHPNQIAALAVSPDGETLASASWDRSIRLWSLGVAVVFAALGFLAPAALKPLNRAWFKFGLLLNRVVSPIVMGIVFFLTVTPIGLIMRARGNDLLSQKMDPEADSYWIEIDEETNAQSSMKRQF